MNVLLCAAANRKYLYGWFIIDGMNAGLYKLYTESFYKQIFVSDNFGLHTFQAGQPEL